MIDTSDESAGAERRVAIVTGSASGLGEACAVELARVGIRVVVNSRTRARCERVAESINAGGGTAFAIPADVTDPESVRALVDRTLERWDRIDILVNNAGAAHSGPTELIDVEDWDRVIDVNLRGPFLCSRAVAPAMLAAGQGVIVNIGSLMSTLGFPGRAAYTASKHGLAGLTKALATEWAERGIRVVAVEPAYIQTDLVEESMTRAGFGVEDLIGRTPMRRLGTPEEVAGVVRFLCSDTASFVTGSSVVVDGGWATHGSW